MVSFETEVYNKQEEDIIGVKVIVVADNGQTIESIRCVNEDDFNDLKAELDVLDEEYVKFSDGSSLAGSTIEQILANATETATINATALGGFQSDAFSKTNHTHVKSAITDLYTYDLTLSSYTAQKGDQITITTTVLKSNNSPVNKHSVILYKNGTLWKTGKTNSQGVFTTTYTADTGGLVTFQVNTTKAQCFVNAWEQVSITPGQMTFHVNESLRLAELKVTNTNAAFRPVDSSPHYPNAIPEQYRPPNQIFSLTYYTKGRIEVDSSGSIYFTTSENSTQSGKNASCTLIWHY